ncbi:unknown [Coraliomargarita sp. CAG:312]|nr:unknown [Coraliomargarita sp. CAG:312]
MKCGREIPQISGTVCNAIFNSYNILRALEERKVDAMKPPHTRLRKYLLKALRGKRARKLF